MRRRVGIARVSRMLLWALAATAVTLLGAAASASAGTLDQQQTSSSTNAGLFTGQSVAQTFTAGETGRLDQVDLVLSTAGTVPASFTVEIRSVSSGQPAGAALATASTPTSSIGSTKAFVPTTFVTPASVTAGTQYAIVAYSPGTPANALGAWYQSSDVYSGGSGFFDSTESIPPGTAWSNLGGDLAFKTYVAPPLPSTPGSGSTPSVGGPTGAPKKKHCKHKKKKHRAASAKKRKCKKHKKKHH